MRKVINKKVYDTEKAKLIAEYSNGLPQRDFKHLYESLYLTANGQFFLHVDGGPLTKYSEKVGNYVSGIETIILLTQEEAYKWLEEHNEIEAIEKYFPDMISEG